MPGVNINNTQFVDDPFHIDNRGRTAQVDTNGHIYDLIYQVLFTNPGERVNRPDFGCGIKQLVFMPSSDVLATATQHLIQGALHRWLDDVIIVQNVSIQIVESQMTITVVYSVRSTGQTQQDTFSQSVIQ